MALTKVNSAVLNLPSHTFSGVATFSDATSPIISAKIGPSSGQQHTLPAVSSDTVALLAASQTFTNKTLTSPSVTNPSISGTINISGGTISGGSIENSPIGITTPAAGKFTNLTVTGTLLIDGTTTTVNSTTITVDDPVITLGGDTAPGADDNKDRGVEFRWHNGTVAKLGFFGYDDSTGRFTFIPDATNTSEVFSGTVGTIEVADVHIGGASTGSGVNVRANTPTLITPVLGVASASNLTLTAANSTADGGGQIYLNGSSGNRIDFNVNGLSAPTNTTRSVGTKLVLYPNIAAAAIDYGFGVESGALWISANGSIKFYQGNAVNTLTINSAGDLSMAGDLTVTGGDITSTRINKVTITAPATGSTLTIINGKTFTVNNTITLSGTDSTTITLPASSGAVPLDNQTMYIGTTAVNINRSTANLALTGISSITLPGATSGTIIIQPAATAGSNTITFPAVTGNVITTGDTGTVTNTMLAGSIEASTKLLSSTSVSTGVTYAKMQYVSAQYRMLGRKTAAAGVVEELTGDEVITHINQGSANTINAARIQTGTSGATIPLLNGANTWSSKQIFTNTVKLQQSLEKVTITASAPSGTFDCLTQGVQYFTTNASANWTQNFRGDGSNSLDSIMATGESITVTVLATQGGTAYYPSAHQVDGSAITPKWLGGTAPTSGDTSSINVYSYTIVKTGAATFTMLASKSKYA